MIRSLYSGVSGMKSHQVRMDVVGNNIANVNTNGYKSSRANFQDTLYQTIRYGSANAGVNGGINPSQVGLGMTVSSITNDMKQGAQQTTSRPLDLAIQGNGWFTVTDGTTNYYTREGVFYVDNAGDMVNSSGLKVLDTGGNPINFGTNGIATINIAKDGSITATDLTGTDISPATGIGLAMFSNQDGLERVGRNLYVESVASGAPIDGTPGAGGFGDINSGYLEMSDVDLTDEFANMITTQRGYQASARTITTSDQMLMELLDLKR